MNWQSIETAPKDGRRILLFEDGIIEFGMWATWRDKPCWVMKDYQTGDLLEAEPTHWAPIIEPERSCRPLQLHNGLASVR
jgi:hypothetical protein